MIKKNMYAYLIFVTLLAHLHPLISAEEKQNTPVPEQVLDRIESTKTETEAQENLTKTQSPRDKTKAEKQKTKTSQNPERSLYLNFENASLGNVFSYLAKQKNINYVPNPALDAQKISLTSSIPMTLDEAWDALLTLMESNNFTLIKLGGSDSTTSNENDSNAPKDLAKDKPQALYHIVPSPQAKTNPLPVYFNHSTQQLPDNNEVIRFLYVLKNLKTEAIKPIFDSMLTPGSVQFLPQMGACIITEKSISIKTVMQLVEELDKGGIREAIKIYPLKHANAMDVAKLFNEEVLGINKNPQQMRIITAPGEEGATFFSKESKIIPDQRTNNLILIGNEDGLNRLISFVEKYIDKPLEAVESRLHVKPLQYVDAEKIKPILDSIIKPPSGQTKSPLVGEIKFFEDVVIAAESTAETGNGGGDSTTIGSGNRLVIACNKDDWRRIEQFIDALDKPQPQVAMEVLIVDVQRDNDKKLGSQIRNKKDGMIGKHINAETTHLVAPSDYYASVGAIPNRSMIPAIGASLQTGNNAMASFGREGNIWGVMRSVIRTNNFNILSQPYLISHSQKKASLDITEQRVVDGELKQSGVNIVRNKETVSAKLNLSITPRINTEGLIELSVDLTQQEFSSADDASSGDHSNRKLTTRATIGEGEVLILGGLTRKKIDESLYKTPILGDIPIIKLFFSSKLKRITNEELFVFIRPTLIKPSFEGRPEEYTQLKLDYAHLAIARQDELLTSADPIDRWFFNLKSKKMGSLETIIESDEIRQLNSFMEAKHQPKSVAISQDPYYVSEEMQAEKKTKKPKKKAKA